jgi:hypothetical protein
MAFCQRNRGQTHRLVDAGCARKLVERAVQARPEVGEHHGE